MKISKKLPQFNERSGLVLVLSGLKAKYIFLSEGLAGEWNFFERKAKEPKSKEGRFETRKSGKVIRGGGVYEDTKETERAEFIKELKSELKRDESNLSEADDLYVFCPEQLHHFLMKGFSKAWVDKIRMMIKGNYYNQHLFELLEIVSSELKTKEVEIAPPPLAAKVLNKVPERSKRRN